MRVGVFGGSFDPIHVGHLIIAESVLNETDLDEVWFMVSPQNPLKSKKNLVSEYDRLRMAELAVGDHPKIRVSNFEFYLPKPSYTIDTLVALKEKYPKKEFSLVMGEDNLRHLHKWKNYEAILKYYKIWVYPRISDEKTQAPEFENVSYFSLAYLDISATRIRELIKAVLQEERAVMHMRTRPEIHKNILQHVKRLVQ